MANGIAEVFTHLVSVLRSDGPTGCATYIDSTLKDLAATYTAVQVPHVLGNVCKSGTYFHSFESADACLKKTEELVKAFEGDKKYGAWCESLATVSESAPAESASAEPAAAEAKKEEPAKECGCVGLPAALIGNSTARKGYPATYGESCAAHDLTTEACSGKYKPAYCYEARDLMEFIFTDFYRSLVTIRRLVLGWIDSYDSNQIVIFSGFSRSTKLSG
jgi:hypothetical protein